jgi:hypothetical protein
MMKQTLFIFTIMLSMLSCREDHGLQGDTIKLSTKKLFSPAEGGDFEVTSQGIHWMIDDTGIRVDSITYYVHCDDDQCSNNWFWTYDGIEYPIEKVKRPPDSYRYIVKIEGPWFTVHKVTDQKIIFSTLPNETGKTRTLKVYLLDGNFGTSITLTQSAD